MARIIGITGGIASGKSTVTEFLRQQGYQVIDADYVVHELQEPGGRLYQALLSAFGPAILQEDGRLDRSKLGAMIFGNSELLAQSSQIQNQISARNWLTGEICWQRRKLSFLWIFPCCLSYNMKTGLTKSGWWM